MDESIDRHGVQTPTTWDDEGNLLDGWEREVLCQEKGVACPREVRHFYSEAEKFRFILSVNTHRRPNLSTKQKRAVIEAYLQGDPEIADNTLAQALGVSKNTVARCRRRLEANREIPKIEKTKGKDGKMRPVNYTKRIVTNNTKEFETAKKVIRELPASCAGKTIDVTTAKRLAKLERKSLQFFPTPPAITLALLKQERFEGSIREPACGTGSIAKVLVEQLPNLVFASDLAYYGYGVSGVNFLESNTSVDNIVTNPPFSCMVQFKRHALQLARKKVAMLMYLHQLGEEIETRSPLRTVYVFDELIPFEGSHPRRLAWYVWEIGYVGPITVKWISLGREITP
jgi:transposase-like protein